MAIGPGFLTQRDQLVQNGARAAGDHAGVNHILGRCGVMVHVFARRHGGGEPRALRETAEVLEVIARGAFLGGGAGAGFGIG